MVREELCTKKLAFAGVEDKQALKVENSYPMLYRAAPNVIQSLHASRCEF